MLKLFHNALESKIKEEIILFMLQRQIRLLLSLLDSGEKSIDEVERLAPWQIGKLQSQSRLFTVSDLKRIYKRLYEIELGQKTGSLPLSLSQSIDFLLLDI
jgi:DNA polymerase III delta subunit